MSVSEQFYRERAAEARAAAAASKLANVSERHQRSADAWEAMADRVRRTDAARAETAAKKAAAIADEG